MSDRPPPRRIGTNHPFRRDPKAAQAAGRKGWLARTRKGHEKSEARK